MRRYFAKALSAQLRAGRSLFALSVAGVALGIGAVLSVQILNQSALGAFAGSVRAVSGGADLVVLGRAPVLPEALVAEVLAEPGVRGAVPVYRVDAALDARPGTTLEVLGVDLFAPFRPQWSLPASRITDALSRPGWIAVTPALAAEMGWRIGDRFGVSSGSRRVRLEVGALVDFQRASPLASRRLAIMDIAQVQGLLGAPGRIHEIEVLAAAGADLQALARGLEARVGALGRVERPEQRQRAAEGLLAAFRLNLTALSLVSLFVGGFLVYASTQAALIRRREEMGLLRSLGATRGQVLRLVLGEAALLGVLGTAIGIPLAVWAARANVRTVSATVENLYLLEGIERVTLSPWLVVLAVAMGLSGAVAGAIGPALDVSRRDPRQLLAPTSGDERLQASAGRLLGAGWSVFAIAGIGCLAAGRSWAASGFVLGVGLLVAIPLSAPWVMRRAASVGRPHRFGIRYGVRSLGVRLQTTSVAAAALAVAVAMLAGITILVGSFRRTVEIWLDDTLHADVYVSTPSWRRARSEATLAPGIVERLAREPGVKSMDTLRQVFGYSGERRVSISGFDARLPQAPTRVHLLSGDPVDAMRRVRDEGAVLVSEPLARKAGLGIGQRIPIHARAGEVRLPIAGVYYDYGTEAGAVLMDLATFSQAFGPGPPSNAALFLAPGVDAEAVVDRIRAEFPDEALKVRSNRRLRDEVLSIFEQTFAVTRLLQAASLLIAVAGITLTLLVLARERAGELALYRALGATRAQIFVVFVGRGVGIALFGAALGAAGGVGLALVLALLINPAYFGWTIGLHWPWRALVEQGAAVLAAATAASVYPALRASRLPATELSRDAL